MGEAKRKRKKGKLKQKDQKFEKKHNTKEGNDAHGPKRGGGYQYEVTNMGEKKKTREEPVGRSHKNKWVKAEGGARNRDQMTGHCFTTERTQNEELRVQR